MMASLTPAQSAPTPAAPGKSPYHAPDIAASLPACRPTPVPHPPESDLHSPAAQTLPTASPPPPSPPPSSPSTTLAPSPHPAARYAISPLAAQIAPAPTSPSTASTQFPVPESTRQYPPAAPPPLPPNKLRSSRCPLLRVAKMLESGALRLPRSLALPPRSARHSTHSKAA